MCVYECMSVWVYYGVCVCVYILLRTEYLQECIRKSESVCKGVVESVYILRYIRECVC